MCASVASAAGTPMLLLRCVLLAACAAVTHAGVSGATSCPNDCSGAGVCTLTRTASGAPRAVCACVPPRTGPDCSRISCPRGGAWVGPADALDSVHSVQSECSGVGVCSLSGACVCPAGFSGDACEKMDCPRSTTGAVCSGHGLCMSMAAAAMGYDGVRLRRPPVRYTQWDAQRIHGCVCDAGFEGWDCSQPTCASGDDPLTTGQSPTVQTISCTCGGSCSGSFSASLFGRGVRVAVTATGSIAGETGSAGSGMGPGESVEASLRMLRAGDVVSSVSVSPAGARVCSASGSVTTITFTRDMGATPLIMLAPGTMASSVGVTSLVSAITTPGTTESLQCSGRGTCNSVNATCACYSGFGPSDGNGNLGSTLDCGHVVNSTLAGVCPGTQIMTVSNGSVTGSGAPCNGQGVCSGSPSFTCSCFRGYTGPACEQRRCPLGRAWWDEATAPDTAHGLEECSNRGTCNRFTGLCECAPGFTGAACDRLACPTSSSGAVCGGRGVCLALRYLSELGTWDGKPRGLPEVQTLMCTATSGSFRLLFRFSESVSIPFNAEISALRDALEALPGTGLVDISPSTGTVCSSTSPTVYAVTFSSLLGDISQISCSNAAVTIRTTRNGTRVGYGSDPASSATWDADMLQGCACDGYPDYNATSATQGDRAAWYGAQCSVRGCPFGIDPAFGTSAVPLRFEVQTLQCSAVAGSFTLSFRGATTAGISAVDTAATLRARLEALPSIGQVTVSSSSTAVCSAAGTATSITFTSELGDLPTLEAASIDLAVGTASVSEAVAGVGTPAECSDRGLCDTNLGVCKCFYGYISSNGLGGRGTRGDCGALQTMALIDVQV